MKRTDRERMDRELARQVKQVRIAEKREQSRSDVSVGGFARELGARLMSDGTMIYNTEDDDVLELLLEMREHLDEKEFSAAVKKAIKATKVNDVQTPYDEMLALVS